MCVILGAGNPEGGGGCSRACFKPSLPWGSKLQHSGVQVWYLAPQAVCTLSLLTAAPVPLPERERWARAFHVWRSLCNHSWYPQSDGTRLWLVPILHLLLISSRMSHNFSQNKGGSVLAERCRRMGVSELWK